MSRRLRPAIVCLVLSLPAAAAAQEGDVDRTALEARLAAQERRLAAQERRLVEQERRLAEQERRLTERGRQVEGEAGGAGGPPEPAPATGPSEAEARGAAGDGADEAPDSDPTGDDGPGWPPFVVTVGEARLRFYGFIRLDAIHDDSRPNDIQTPGFIRAEDRAAPAGLGARKDAEDLVLTPRFTRLGLDLTGPRVEAIDAELSGRIEVDFQTNAFTESREALRLRHAWLRLDWGPAAVLAGQTNDVISPLVPTVANNFAMWQAGNLGDRRPQLLVEVDPDLGALGRVVAQVSAGLAGAVDGLQLDPAGTFGQAYRDGETSALPIVQGRLGYERELWAGQRLAFGVWGHREWIDPDERIAGEDRFDSWSAGLDLRVPLWSDVVWVQGELWTGRNLTDVRGGVFQGIDLTRGKEIASRGGWVELGIRPCEQYSITFGYSTDDPHRRDLPAIGITANRVAYVANRVFFGPLTVGVDYLRWETSYRGFHAGRDDRVQAFLSYGF